MRVMTTLISICLLSSCISIAINSTNYKLLTEKEKSQFKAFEERGPLKNFEQESPINIYIVTTNNIETIIQEDELVWIHKWRPFCSAESCQIISPFEAKANKMNVALAFITETADIEYIQKKLLTALRVPKAFLGFEEPVGDGKNLSLMDIRFARTINRIQKSMVAELNKIAIVHLFLLGFEDELSNFTLSLTNPSSQADLLKIDIWKEKVALYKECVTSIEGIAPTSVSWAKKHVMGFSDEEIKLDLQQQRIEKAVGAELTNTATIITNTGVFDNVDKLYTQTSGTTSGGAPPAGGAPPPAGGPEGMGERFNNRDNLNILLENEGIFDESSIIDLSKAKNYLGEMENQLSKLLKD